MSKATTITAINDEDHRVIGLIKRHSGGGMCLQTQGREYPDRNPCYRVKTLTEAIPLTSS